MKTSGSLFVAALMITVGCAGTAVDRPQDDNLGSGTPSPPATDNPNLGGGDQKPTTKPAFEEGAVYAQSARTLYRVDITAAGNKIVEVGDFQGIGSDSVIDIALDAKSKAYAVTYTGLYKLDTQTAACTRVAGGSFPNSLSFVPAGTVDAAEEALVGYLNADYVRIATTGVNAGKVTTIRAKALGEGLVSSGDIVAVAGKAFLTVKASSSCNESACRRCKTEDCLVSINAATGEVLDNRGPIGRSSVFGLAFWAGKAYGFSDGGALFTVDIESPTISTASIPFSGAPSGLSFYGAGSSTAAPVSSVQ